MDSRISKAPMPNSQRAKIFQPFDALKGLKEAIAAKEYVPVERKYLTEERVGEISKQLGELNQGDMITVVYFSNAAADYVQLTGPVKRIDAYRKELQLIGVCIDFSMIYDLEKIDL